MSTTIEWTDETWNPTTGCTRVSPGCDHCYIERTFPFRQEGRRFDKDGTGGTTGVRLHPDRLEQPLHWRKPRRVFVNSLSDLFHDDIPEHFIRRVWNAMAHSPDHVFQILTKRPRRMVSVLQGWERQGTFSYPDPRDTGLVHAYPAVWRDWPLPNVWLGVSVEDQKRADLRIPLLLEMPAAVRFLSCEPLLGPVDLSRWVEEWQRAWAVGLGDAVGESGRTYRPQRIHWVIVGGESGPGARPMHPEWARSLCDQCVAAGVPFFFKQFGAWRHYLRAEDPEREPGIWIKSDGRTGTEQEAMADGGSWQGLWHFTKHAAGRELDGRTWDEYPLER